MNVYGDISGYVVWFEESFLPYLASRNVNVVSASVIEAG